MAITSGDPVELSQDAAGDGLDPLGGTHRWSLQHVQVGKGQTGEV